MSELFRGKRCDNKEWVKGYLFRHLGKPYIILGMENDQIHSVEVIEETVSSNTGIPDKNGDDIFIGDIIVGSFWWWGPIVVFLHRKQVGGCHGDNVMEYIGRNDRHEPHNLWDGDQVVILGNKWDNPELLTKKYRDGCPQYGFGESTKRVFREAATIAIIDAVSTVYKKNGIPFSATWEAISKQAERELKKEAEVVEK